MRRAQPVRYPTRKVVRILLIDDLPKHRLPEISRKVTCETFVPLCLPFGVTQQPNLAAYQELIAALDDWIRAIRHRRRVTAASELSAPSTGRKRGRHLINRLSGSGSPWPALQPICPHPDSAHIASLVRAIRLPQTEPFLGYQSLAVGTRVASTLTNSTAPSLAPDAGLLVRCS